MSNDDIPFFMVERKIDVVGTPPLGKHVARGSWWRVTRVISRTIIIRIPLKICMVRLSYPEPLKERQTTFQPLYPRKSKRRWQSVDTRIVSTTHPDIQHDPSGYKSSGWSIKVKRVLHAITTSSHGPHPITCRVRRQGEVTASHFPRSFYIITAHDL